jgi:UDP-N-acetylmuramoylalanine--D-glutamate ligase
LTHHDLKRIVVLGAGESGIGAAILAKKKGYQIFISDNGIIKKNYKDVLSHADIPFEEQRHSQELILDADEVIKSPGIPDNIPVILEIKKRGIPVISEIEFASRFTTARKICITGSNGKTTTTLLIGHILKKAGINACVAGNVGNSFAMQVASRDYDYYVLEISSFQLDGMYDFKADVTILMNITPDHLDRYNYDFQQYTDAKFRIIRNQTEQDTFIYCADDEVIGKELLKREIPSRKYPFSVLKIIAGEGGYLVRPFSGGYTTDKDLKDNRLRININSQILEMTLENLALQGRHNIYNSLAAGIAARVLDLRKEVIKESLSDFQNIEHRLEYVAKIHGIEFVNDSKATNVNSTWYALESINKPIIWIAGGVDKGNDYSQLRELVHAKVKAIVCMGLDNKKIIEAFSDLVPIISEAHSAEEAVNSAYASGAQGDVVLLSPACASFDLFSNYEDRGRKFKNAVKKL